MWMMSVPTATWTVAGISVRAAAARRLKDLWGSRACRIASPTARPSPSPAATPSRVAPFRKLAVSRAIPKVPRSRPGPTSSEVRPPQASSKSWTRQAPFMATAESRPRSTRPMMSGPRPARRGAARGDAKRDVDLAIERSSVTTAEADALDVPLPAGLDRAQHARRAAARGDRDGHIAGDAEGPHLAGEDVVVAVIVGDRGE